MTNNPFAYAFDANKHIASGLLYNPSLPVLLSFDFNKDPITCIAGQSDGARFRRGLWFVSIEASPSVFGSWKWVVGMTDRNEVRTSYGVTKLLCDFLRFGA